jgi:hypothetical protein
MPRTAILYARSQCRDEFDRQVRELQGWCDEFLPVGGWAVYGAARTVTELLDAHFDHPAHDALRTASLQFLRERGVPNSMLAGNELNYW